MLFVKGMISTLERILDIPENRVHPLEGGMFDGLFSATDHMRFMDASRVLHRVETRQPVGNNRGSGLEASDAPVFNFFQSEAFDLRKLDSLRLFIFVGFDGRDERRFPSRTATSLTAHAFSSDIGIVDLYSAPELFRHPALKHDLHEFVFDSPAGIAGNADLPGKLHRGNSVFTLSHQVHREKPFCQRQVTRLKYSPGNQRGLVTTPIALKQFPLLYFTVRRVAAHGACESTRPAKPEKSLAAFFLGAVSIHEVGDAHAFLKLNLVFSHVIPPSSGILPLWAQYKHG